MHIFANTLRLLHWPTCSRYNAHAWLAHTQLSRKYSTEHVLGYPRSVATTTKIQTGLNSFKTVTIFNAPRSPAAGLAGPVILYIGHGSKFDVKPSSRSRSTTALDLALAANATVVFADLNNVLECPYPGPIHQVLRIYDWAKKNIARNEPSIHDPLSRSKIGVCGELVGGSLAAMLALTECHSLMQGVNAAAIGNPIVDWTAIFTPEMNPAPASAEGLVNNPKKDAVVERAPTILKSLLNMRGKLFTKAEKYYDPFASPLLFFRTPSSDLPTEFDRLDLEGDLDTSHETTEAIKKRRSLRKYPPRASDLVLPHMRVDTGKENVLWDQGVELIDLMRRSHGRAGIERNTLQDALPSRNFSVVERQGFGWWHEKEIQEIGDWFGEVLRRPD
ncbi:hypothetical protein JMJ35_002647 [Cladonia borealis]|uniref:Alpha/beta hydrolase fold-3 domain-containing protein n=1 Tax=Cladonia borealis TaxID=184061 RepID=A0AA39R5J0_9LECA|nr:hypothetical protein JMJ35_002647 [Cladonia borealis]